MQRFIEKLSDAPPIFDIVEWQQRRKCLIDRIRLESEKALVVIPATSESQHMDGVVRYRPDSYFLYFAGLREPDALLLIDIQDDHEEVVLFLRPKNEALEIWNGQRLGVEAAPDILGVDAAYALDQWQERTAKRLEKHHHVYYALGRDRLFDQQLTTLLEQQRRKIRQGASIVQTLSDFRHHADAMRCIKSPFEIEQMRFSTKVSATIMTEAMAQVKPGVSENQLMGFLWGAYLQRGLSAPSYHPIVGAGSNACILHYVENNCMLPDQGMVLMDAGGEYYGYCADITRTVPVGGQFSSIERDLYQIVLGAHHQAIDVVKPGHRFNEYHDVAVRVITEGLLALGLLSGTLESAIAQEQYRTFFMHQTGHFLGGDTHDVGIYQDQAGWRVLEAGMILTVEPGLYIRPSSNVPKAFHNIGIRLEDDIMVTDYGSENLTITTPIEISDVEALFQ